ncbi:Tyrosine/nicotianamine aminotransferase [Trema orientale]|uniref:Tyrosine/nicotianamine aminotransferase n=1 Tax=Trema orientale TaxID=63057 RepID=A0A2P5DNG6_TREOI|nr:Tyrosine/nicotianamine aminotransferase [Trema orientale]
MELDEELQNKWGFQRNRELSTTSVSIRSVLTKLVDNINKDDQRPLITLARTDPSVFPCFRTSSFAADSIADAVKSFQFNGYAPSAGVPSAKRAIAEHLSRDLSYQLSADHVYLTAGCTQAIEITISALAHPGANILLPRPGYPQYEAQSAFDQLEVRHFDLLPEKAWEVDLASVEALADENTVAMVIINPGNPCGNVFTRQHLKKIAESARKLGIFVVSDEVYGRQAFGDNPFVPMGEFGTIVPVITLGSLSKQWVVPGWRLGWIVTCDPKGVLQASGFVECIETFLDITTDPPTFLQGALPQIIEKTKDEFFSNILNILSEAANICYERVKEIPCLTCPHKPEGSMTVMVKLNLSLLEGINDDMDFCLKLAKEESITVLPGFVVGLKNWLRVTFAIDPSYLDDGLRRIKAFYLRHAKKC